MKSILILTCLLFANTVYATVKLQAIANGYDNNQNVRPQFGIVLYQPIFKSLVLNAYAGIGIEAFDNKDDVRWTVAKGSIDYTIKRITVGAGYAHKDNTEVSNGRDYSFIKLEYKLF